MKRTLSALLAILILAGALSLPAFSGYAADETYVLGDADRDGVANAKDSALIVAFVLENAENVPSEAADINADGKINSRDVYYYKAVFAGVTDFSAYENNFTVYKSLIGGSPLENYCITLPDTVDPDGQTLSVQNAANLLQRGIWETTGIYPVICNVSSPVKEHTIEFHTVECGGTVNGHYIGVEEYYYKVTPGHVDIYGSQYRGNIYAVYEILEEYFGVYPYSCAETLMMKKRLSNMETGTEIYHTSTFSYRFAVENFYDPGTRYGALDYYFPMRLNGTQMGAYTGDYYGSLTGPHGYNAHSFQEYYCMHHGEWPQTPNSDRYYDYIAKRDSCPDPNARNDWQPCASDDAAYAELFDGLLLTMEMLVIPPHGNHIYRNDVGLSAISFSICDNGDFCSCSMCRAKANGTQLKLRGAQKDHLSVYTGDYELSEDGKYVTFKKESYSGLYLDMGNRAAEDIQEYYPGMKIYMIIYDHTVPETIRPDKNIILMYCGNGCNNHYINSKECGDNLTYLGSNNTETVETLNAWKNMCHESGAEIWFWYYPITNGYYLNGCPNILNIYYDFTYLAEIGVDGIYYEGGDQEYNFETMKAYLGAKVMWDPDMTYEEYTDIMKEYLRVYYGDGYEYIYQYILLDNESGNECGCFQNNHDRPFDMHSKTYLGEHYEQMHDLLNTALGMCRTDAQHERLTLLYYCAEFMGLSGAYERLYRDGDSNSRALYEERYTAMYNYMYERDLQVFHTPDLYSVPDELDFTVSPMEQFYGFGSWNGWDK